MSKGPAGRQNEGPKHGASSRNRFWVFAATLGIVGGVLLYQAGRQSPQVTPPQDAGGAVGSSRTETRPLSEGVRVPQVDVLSLAGQRFRLKAPSGTAPVLLYIFSPTCSICTRTIPVWKQLHAVARERGSEVIGISVLGPTQTGPYVRQHEIPWEVYCVAGRDAVAALGIERVPTTAVIGPDGRVLKLVQGELTPERRQAVTVSLTGR